jgi:hypothetical protein
MYRTPLPNSSSDILCQSRTRRSLTTIQLIIRSYSTIENKENKVKLIELNRTFKLF